MEESELDEISNYLDNTIERLDREACSIFDLNVIMKRISGKQDIINKIRQSSDTEESRSDTEESKKGLEIRRSMRSDILMFQHKSAEYIKRNEESPISGLRMTRREI